MRAIVTISTIKGYANGTYAVGWTLDQFTTALQSIEENTFVGSSISWLVTPARTVYNTAWRAPKGGEDVFVLETDYTEYDNSTTIDDWKNRVIAHAKYLKNYFEQSTVRVTFINDTETIILK